MQGPYNTLNIWYNNLHQYCTPDDSVNASVLYPVISEQSPVNMICISWYLYDYI